MARISIDMKGGTINKTKKVIVGIDLGTTNSLIAVMKEGKAVALKADNSHNLLPSIVHIKENSDYVVGKDALRYLLEDPANTVFSVKRLLGKSYSDVENHQSLFPFEIIDEKNDALVKIKMRDRYLTPVEISAIILKELKKKAESILNANVEQAVITVPAYFNDAQRQATRDAGKLAGLDVLRIINEPTAAALSYGLQTNADGETIAVYDLGGGTFDLSILSINDGIFEVLSTHGDTYLGGDDFDRAILDYWQEEYGISNREINSYRIKAEAAKMALSVKESYSNDSEKQGLEITRETFERIIEPLIQKTITACDKAIKDAEIDKNEITRVVMVGGSTRIPYVQKMVSEFFGKQVHCDLDPDEVVALGAAIQADILAGNRKDLLLLDITPLSLGIETVGGLMDVLIPRNTTVPSRLARSYTTSIDGQKNLKIAVYQGERDMIVDNRKLGEFILKGLPPMPAGIPKIEIQFLIDANGILKVKAKELRSEMEQEIDIKPSYGISEEEMGRMLRESIKYASMDMKKKALVEAQVEANNIILSTTKFITQNKEWLEQKVKNELEDLKTKLITEVKEGSKDEINLAMENLTVYSKPFAHVALERDIASAIKGIKL